MHTKYRPGPGSHSCPKCDFLKEGFPELVRGRDEKWKSCPQCGTKYVMWHGQLVEEATPVLQRGLPEKKDDGDPNKPGRYLTTRQRISAPSRGFPNPPRSPGTGGSAPSQPTRPVTGPNQPVPKKVPPKKRVPTWNQ